MGLPQFKVSITHNAVTTDYISSAFKSIDVKRRENNYDVATLVAGNNKSEFYPDYIDVLDDIKIYLRDATDTTGWPQVFGGTVRQANPSLSPPPDGSLVTLLCKSYGAALEETHCNRDYGLESSNNTKDTAKKIWTDIVTNLVNKSLGTGINTGYVLTTTKIADICAATPIKYVNNPYRTNLEVVDLICDLTSAIGAGTTAGAHWIVDNDKNLIINTISAHENTTEWPDWYNTDEAGSTLEEGVDFNGFTVLDKSEEFANRIVLLTPFRRPAYDYWTEDSGGSALWGNDGLTSIIDDNYSVGSEIHFVVGSHSLKFDPDTIATGYGYFPKTSADWNVTKWGSERTVPTLNFYGYKYNLVYGQEMPPASGAWVLMSTNNTARKTHYYYCAFFNLIVDADKTWTHFSIPIGPYWASGSEARRYRWGKTGSPTWADIDTIEFVIQGAGTDGFLCIDDLHFAGQIARSAYNSTNITANKEYQKVLISKNSMDDSCIANDDSGFAARVAYAELLRRQSLPTTIVFTVKGKPSMMAGQKLHVHACKQVGGGFAIDSPMRILEAETKLVVPDGFTTTVTATTDLLNSTPISVPDQYAMWMENMFLNSKEAKNIRSSSDTDLLIPLLTRDYP